MKGEIFCSIRVYMLLFPSFDRVFARSRHRKTANSTSGGSGSNEAADSFDPYRSWSPLTEEGYAEKLRLLREAASVPMERWRAPTVLAWLEVALGMPQYGPRCAENVKSGKVKDSSSCLILLASSKTFQPVDPFIPIFIFPCTH